MRTPSVILAALAFAGCLGFAACTDEDSSTAATTSSSGSTSSGTGGVAQGGGGTGGVAQGGGGTGGMTGGTGGTGGAAQGGGGTGGIGGAPVADCYSCSSANCGNEINACQLNATCLPWLQCAQLCTDSACTDMCDMQYPNAKPQYDPIYACNCNNCPADCAIFDPCPNLQSN